MTDSQQPNISKPISFDVIIAGAMAGATLALALQHLSQGKLKVAVIEAFATDHSAHPGFDARSIAPPTVRYKSCRNYNFGLAYSLCDCD